MDDKDDDKFMLEDTLSMEGNGASSDSPNQNQVENAINN